MGGRNPKFSLQGITDPGARSRTSDDLTPENLPKYTEAGKPARDQERPAAAALSDDETARAMEFLRQEQNLLLGTMAGFLAAVAGAAVWAGITVAAGYPIGWLAVGIGIVAGLAVRLGGKGIDPIFGVLGGAMALIGCLLGNVFTIAWYLSIDTGTPVIDVLSQMDIAIVIELILESFMVTDILFYVLAVYFGYRYAFRELTPGDYDRALGRTLLT